MGLGGIFFKCNDPAKMNEWYSKNIGLQTDDYGTSFEWRKADDEGKKGFTTWSPFPADIQYFEPQNEF
jgi:hypothetical protein